MPKALRVLVLGSGFAGQGHAEAFRNAGVEIIGMVSRTLSVTQQVAKEMNIPYATTDWKTALTQLQPDIVAVGTPGGVHVDPILAALDQSCHIYSDKPLAATAKEAKMLYLKAREEGAKTAYAASMRYLPYALLAKSLIAQGKIGDPLEVECISHPNVNPLIPFGWFHRLDQGGGRTHSNFPHKLSIVQQALNGTIVSVNGQLRYDIQRAPIAAGVHDFRKRGQFAPQSADEPGLEGQKPTAIPATLCSPASHQKTTHQKWSRCFLNKQECTQVFNPTTWPLWDAKQPFISMAHLPRVRCTFALATANGKRFHYHKKSPTVYPTSNIQPYGAGPSSPTNLLPISKARVILGIRPSKMAGSIKRYLKLFAQKKAGSISHKKHKKTPSPRSLTSL
jgi:hypothetical protein